MKKFAHLQRRKPSIVDESNHDGSKQESFLKQERFVRIEITFTLGKNGGYNTSGLGGRLFPVVRLPGWLMKISLFEKILKSCNSPSNLFLEYLNRFLALYYKAVFLEAIVFLVNPY